MGQHTEGAEGGGTRMMCCECRWWRPREELEHYCELDDGECFRFPPFVPCVNKVTDFGVTVPEVIRGTVLTTYPITNAEEFCGEFVRKVVE